MNYAKIYNQLCTKRKQMPYVGTIISNHHITMRSKGGTDDSENIIKFQIESPGPEWYNGITRKRKKYEQHN